MQASEKFVMGAQPHVSAAICASHFSPKDAV